MKRFKQKEFAVTVDKISELLDTRKDNHCTVFVGEILKAIIFGIYDLEDINHWIVEETIKTKLKFLCNKKTLWPALALIRLEDYPEDNRISKIIGINVAKDPKITYGDQFYDECIEWIKNGRGKGKYIRFESNINKAKDNKIERQKVKDLLKNLALLFTGQLKPQVNDNGEPISCFICNKKHRRIVDSISEIDYDSIFAKKLEYEEAKTLLIEFIISYFREEHCIDIEYLFY